MALQGTIETFALPDVLRLLASTKKTGCLRLEGARGSGSVWVDGGQVVASEASSAPRADGAVEVVFELLRFKDGEFVFDADVSPASSGSPEEVEPVLGKAEEMLDEWRGIEAVVPSLGTWVSISPDLPEDEIVIDRARWHVISLVGGGITVGVLGDGLELGELAVSRQVKELVEAGLVSLGSPPDGSSTADAFAVITDPVVEDDSGPALTLNSDTEVSFVDEAEFEPFDPAGLVVEPDETDAPVVAAAPEPVAEVAPAPEPTDAAEIARQLANLSPKAAKAVAAAAKATTQEERERALAEVDDGEDPINRELLIKFLGSVNS